MKLGFIGLGKMGSRMVVKLLADGHSLVVWNRSEQAILNLKSQISLLRSATPNFGGQANLKSTSQNLKTSKTVQELVKNLDKPRVIWLMVTAGSAAQTTLDELSKFVEEGDIIIDGGNSYYKDTERRYYELRTKNIRFLGIGVSGGIIAAQSGYPLMVGGDKSAYEYIKPVLDSLAKPARDASQPASQAMRGGQGNALQAGGGHEYFGEGGSGHFVKMVHNGIEYGMMQSIGEGFGILEKAPYKLDLLKVAKLWQKGTLVSGFMLDRVVDVFTGDPKLTNIKGYIEESGEGKWTIEQAKLEGVPIEIIEKSLEFRSRSEKYEIIQNSFAAKLIASLRNAFGGHEVKKK